MSHLITDSRMKVVTQKFSKAYANCKPKGEIWYMWTDTQGQHYMHHVDGPSGDWDSYKKQHSHNNMVIDPVTVLCLQAGVNSIDIPFVANKSIAAQNINKAILLIGDKETIYVQTLGFTSGYTIQNAKNVRF